MWAVRQAEHIEGGRVPVPVTAVSGRHSILPAGGGLELLGFPVCLHGQLVSIPINTGNHLDPRRPLRWGSFQGG